MKMNDKSKITCHSNDKESAFSLAELMVILVIVSVMMAVAAPLIAGKSNADPNKQFSMRGNTIMTALGKFQKFVIGIGPTSSDDKLIVNGDTKIIGDLKTNKLDGIVTAKDGKFNFNQNSDKHLLMVEEGDDGSILTNLLNKRGNTYYKCTGGQTCNVGSNDGYILANLNSGITIKNENSTSISLVNTDDTPPRADYITTTYIPVKRGMSFTCGADCYFYPMEATALTVSSSTGM